VAGPRGPTRPIRIMISIETLFEIIARVAKQIFLRERAGEVAHELFVFVTAAVKIARTVPGEVRVVSPTFAIVVLSCAPDKCRIADARDFSVQFRACRDRTRSAAGGGRNGRRSIGRPEEAEEVRFRADDHPCIAAF
jgi:hypothetical protein